MRLWFGGKRRAADIVWQRFGNVVNYVEPFAGSLAVLLCRPTPPGTETVNDADCYLANFWRALSADPEQVSSFADWPVNEADLLARHKWLIAQDEFLAKMKSDPHFYDAKIAGWWVWGICSWIGQGWCHTESAQLPHLGDAGRGINRKLPHLGDAGRGINRKLPHLGDAGRALPNLRGDSGATGNGIHSSAFNKKTGGIYTYFSELSNRLRNVRVACGDWTRILGESVTVKHGITGVFLDPPYGGDRNQEYAVDGKNIAADVEEWARENGENSLLRIALCGYEGDYLLPGWHEVKWKAAGGYGSQGTGQGRKNSERETIWFSPHCIVKNQLKLF